MRNFKLKKLLTVMLLLFLLQNAKCGIVFLVNEMDYRLKFAVMPANDDIHEKKKYLP